MKKWLIVLLAVLSAFSAAACHADIAAADDVVSFDAGSAGWKDAGDVRLFLLDLDKGVLSSDDSEEFTATEGKNSIRSFQIGSGVQTGHEYCVVFHNADTGEGT